MKKSTDILRENLIRLQDGLGLTQIQLAERASIDNATLSRILAGGGNPTLSTIDTIAEGLGLTSAQLLTDGEAPAFRPLVVKELVQPSSPDEAMEMLVSVWRKQKGRGRPGATNRKRGKGSSTK